MNPEITLGYRRYVYGLRLDACAVVLIGACLLVFAAGAPRPVVLGLAVAAILAGLSGVVLVTVGLMRLAWPDRGRPGAGQQYLVTVLRHVLVGLPPVGEGRPRRPVAPRTRPGPP